MNREAAAAIASLSPRQQEVAVMLAQGYTQEQVAVLLNLSVHTVRSHRFTLFAVLGIKKITQLAVLCTLAGLVADWRTAA